MGTTQNPEIPTWILPMDKKPWEVETGMSQISWLGKSPFMDTTGIETFIGSYRQWAIKVLQSSLIPKEKC
jgi:hypothetical protein